MFRLELTMDCVFTLDPDDSLKCCICYEVAKEAKQEEACGKLFCSTCIESWQESSCPACRIPVAKYFIDNRSELVLSYVVQSIIYLIY